MISISNLSKNFGDLNVLNNINLTVAEGEIYGLVGESGSGKSTLLRCINGLIPYDSGELIVDNIEIKSLKTLQLREFRRNIGMIFQHFSLLDRLNVYENIAFPMRIWRYSNQDVKTQVMRMLELVGLEDKIHNMPKELSGGQKQRVAIARSLVLNPKFLLSDESTSALDPKIGKSILNLIKDINDELGITVILVTHQMEVVRQTCDRMALLENGEIALDGSVKNVFLKNPPAFQALLGQEDKVNNDNKLKIRVLIDQKNEYKKFFSTFSRDTNIEFDYLSGGIELFKQGECFLGIIAIDKEALDTAKNYFDQREISFEVMDNGI